MPPSRNLRSRLAELLAIPQVRTTSGPAELARALGCSRQRVAQLLRALGYTAGTTIRPTRP